MDNRIIALLILLILCPISFAAILDPTALEGDVVIPSVKVFTLDLNYQSNFVVGDSFYYIVTLENPKNISITEKIYAITAYDPAGEIIDESKYSKEINASSSIELSPKYPNQIVAQYKIFDFKQTGIYRINIVSSEKTWFYKLYNRIAFSQPINYAINPSEYNFYFEVISPETFSQREENRSISENSFKLAKGSYWIALLALGIALIDLFAHDKKRKILLYILIMAFVLSISYVLLIYFGT